MTLEITPEARERLLKDGYKPEYGAREIERTLNSTLTPLLMREILFGGHKGAFKAIIGLNEGNYTLTAEE